MSTTCTASVSHSTTLGTITSAPRFMYPSTLTFRAVTACDIATNRRLDADPAPVSSSPALSAWSLNSVSSGCASTMSFVRRNPHDLPNSALFTAVHGTVKWYRMRPHRNVGLPSTSSSPQSSSMKSSSKAWSVGANIVWPPAAA